MLELVRQRPSHSELGAPSQELEDELLDVAMYEQRAAAGCTDRATPFAPDGLQGPCTVTRLANGEVSIDPQLLDAQLERYRAEAKGGNRAIAYALLGVTFVVFVVLLWPWLSERFGG